MTGNFNADVQLNGAGVLPGRQVLGRVAITGTVADAVFAVAGSVGSFIAGRFLDSRMLAGYVPFDPANAMAGGAFLTGAAIGVFQTRGNADPTAVTFAGSVIAATRISTAILKKVDADNAGSIFGVLADESIRSVTVARPTFRYAPRNPASQGWGDFVVQIT